MYDRYQFEVFNEHPPNAFGRVSQVPTYQCPSDQDMEELIVPASGPGSGGIFYARGSYRGNAGLCEHGFWDSSSEGDPFHLYERGPLHGVGPYDGMQEPVTLRKITDGQTNTLLLGEKSHYWTSDEGKRRCAATWQSAANGKVHDCHAGLCCVGAPVEVGGRPVAITVGCQFTVQAPLGERPAWESNLPDLAAELGLSEEDLRTAAESVHLVPNDRLDRIARLLVRVADTFAEVGRERLSLLSRLEYIAEVSRV